MMPFCMNVIHNKIFGINFFEEHIKSINTKYDILIDYKQN